MRTRYILSVIGAIAITAMACNRDDNKPTSTGTTGGQVTTPQPAQPAQPAPAAQPAPEASARDRQFIDMMVPFREEGMTMARLAADRAQHPELKTLAKNMIDQQDTDIKAMKGLRKEWFGTDATPPASQMPMMPGVTMSPEMHRMMDPATMRSHFDKAKPFDKAFLDASIERHKTAIQAADLEQQQGTRDELKTLAKKIRDQQQRELDEMQSMRDKWYGGGAK